MVQDSDPTLSDDHKRMRASHDLLHALAEGTGEMIASVDRELRYTLANSAYRRTFRQIYQRDLNVGDRVNDLLAHRPDDLAAAIDRWNRAFAGETLTLPLEFTDGTDTRALDCRFYPLRDRAGVIVGAGEVVRDVSSRRRAAAALAESEARFRALFEQAVVGLVITDLQGRVLRANDAFCALVGRPAEALIGKESSTYTHADDRAINVANISRLRSENFDAVSYEKRYIQPDGSVVHAQVNISPMRDAAHSAMSLIAIVEDVTDRRRTDRITQESEARLRFLAELDEQTRDLPTAEAVMEASSRLLGQRMRVSRCAYAEVDADEEHFTIWHDYVDGCLSTKGDYLLSLFGPRAANDQRSGRTLLLGDVDRELPADGEGAAMFNAIGVKAIICCPLVRGGRLVAMMAVHQTQPRHWTAAEVALVEAVVERSWSYLERSRTARVLRESEARLADVVRTALDCIIGMDENGLVTGWNPAAEQTFGITRENALGKEMAALIIPPALRPMHRTGLARYLSTGETGMLGRRLELYAIRGDGSDFPVELTITRNTLSARPSFTGYVRDITDRKRAEAERDALLQSERDARGEAERASQTKDEFLATLSHELRTPLNAILGWSQIVRRPGVKPDDLKQGLDVIERNARAQAQIIEDLLDMSRIVSGKVRLDVQPLNLAALTASALETARPAADAKGIHVQSVLNPMDGVVVVGDPGRLQQVLWNLITNAIKFTPRGGRVQVLLRPVDGHIEFSVMDTGEGISADFLPFVFDRFRQADASTTRRHGGLGLGLSIVRQLVELHGGSVRAESLGEGQGSTFTVTLPLTVVSAVGRDDAASVRPPSDARGSDISNERPSTDIELPDIRVLIVDDEADARTLIRRLLEEARATVVTADSAAEAMELLQTERFDVLISDIGMPGEDGYSLIRRVRALGAAGGGDVPAIALTAFARTEDRVRAVVAGFQMHIAKPLEPAELLAMVGSLAHRPPSAEKAAL